MVESAFSFLEQTAAQILFAGYRLTNTFERALTKFEEESRLITSVAQTHTLRKLQQTVQVAKILGVENENRNWSIAMTLHHLNQVNSAILGLIHKLVHGDEPTVDPFSSSQGTPTEVSPDIVQLYQEVSSNYLHSLQELPELRSDKTFSHPWFGALDAKGWNCLAAVHQTVHRRQIVLIDQVLRGEHM